MKVLVHVRD